MRATLITVFLFTFALFIGGLVYRVDGLMFGDKLAWSEAQARAQMSPLVQSVESRFVSMSETLGLMFSQIQDAKKDYGSFSALSKFQMVSLLKSNGGNDWSFEKLQYFEKSSVKSWAENYLQLLLKTVDAKDIKPGQFAVYSLLSPERKPFLFVLHLMPLHVDGADATKNQWFGVLTGPEFLQTFLDRSKGQVSEIFLVSPQGKALAHTVPEYVGNQIKEDPIVAEIIKNQATSGSGSFANLKGENIQGVYEQVGRSNVYAVITTPVSALLKSRDEIRWQLVLFGLGLSFVGVALFVFVYQPERQIIRIPAAGSAPGAAVQKSVNAPMPNGSMVGAAVGTATEVIAVSPSGHTATHVIPVGSGSSGPPRVTPPSANVAEEIQKEKMQAFMQFSSALAHELNGPLSSILGHSQLLKGNGPSNEHIESIAEQARISRELLRKLMTFAGESTAKYEKTNLARVMDRCLTVMEPKFFRKGIQVSKDYKQVPDFEIPTEMLSRAIECVLNNAVEAMDRAPKKELRVGIGPAPDSKDWIEITIRDHGDGIEASEMDKVFDPFFSTRKGHAGLGLSMAMGVFKDINGKIKLDSKKGSGTTVHLFLNLQEKKTNEVAPSKPRLIENKPNPVNLAPQLKLKPADRLIVLQDEEVDAVLDGHDLDEVLTAPEVDSKLEEKLVPSEVAKNLPPVPEDILPPVVDMPEPGKKNEIEKIEKPQIQIDKKILKSDQVGFQIRKPGGKA